MEDFLFETGNSAMNRRSFLRKATVAILAITRSGQIAEALDRDTTGASPVFRTRAGAAIMAGILILTMAQATTTFSIISASTAGSSCGRAFYRTCENNVLVNNTLHPHVWYNDSDDIFRSNIVFRPYRPIQMREWTEVIDFNLLHQPAMPQTSPATALQKLSSQDDHSLQGDALFVDDATGDYRVKANSPALSLGFVNFSMNDFGVQSPKLEAQSHCPATGDALEVKRYHANSQ